MVSMSDPLVDSTQLDHTERDHDTVPARSGRSAAEDEVVQLCSELIRIDSVNTGDPDTIGDGEARAARYIQAKLEEVGYETVYLEAVPGRGNVICRLAGADPGRGAVDMKDMVAMTIAVAREFKRTGYVPPRDLIFAFMSDEEAGGAWGSQWLVEHHPELFTDATEAISEVGGFSITLDDQRRAYRVAALVVERDGKSADLGDRLGGVGEQLGMVLDQPLRPPGAAGLLVRHERENQVPRRYVAGAFELPGHGDRHGHHVLHVHRAAPRVGAGQPADHVAAAGNRLQVNGLVPDLLELGLDVPGCPGLPVTDGVRVAGVHRVDPDQLAAQLDDLVLGGAPARARGHGVVITLGVIELG